MAPVPDDTLRALIRSDPDRGWQRFIDQYTPLILGLIRRAGVRDRDEMMEVYVVLCEQLSARGFERLRSQNAARGSIGGWLAVVTRHAVVDWVRSQKGRRRLFHAVEDLPGFERRVFELYYWHERTLTEIAEAAAVESGGEPDLGRVFAALEAINGVLTARHRAELLAAAARGRTPAPLDDSLADAIADRSDRADATLASEQLEAALEAALQRLPSEDAAIVRLKYLEGLSTPDVERALGVASLTRARLEGILASLREALART